MRDSRIRAARGRAAPGFSLIEVAMAMVVLGMVAAGALSAFVAASQQLRSGQTRQSRSLLVDATAQRWVLGSKAAGSTLWSGASALSTSCSTSPCNMLAIGAAPWAPDPTQTTKVAGDLSTGAYFTLNANGSLVQLDNSAGSSPKVPDGTACNAVPDNVYCREVLVTTSNAPLVSAGATPSSWSTFLSTTPSILPAGSTVYTVWVRVSKKGDTPAQAVNFTESFVQ
jgi:prepilin-type N-terminal cleavage/methylation domain-containing protein